MDNPMRGSFAWKVLVHPFDVVLIVVFF